MAIDDKALAVLFTIAEDQQKALGGMLAQLAGEIGKLATAAAAARQASAAASQAAAAVGHAAGQVEQAVYDGVGVAIEPALGKASTSISKEVRSAMTAATVAMIGQMQEAIAKLEKEVARQMSASRDTAARIERNGARLIVASALVFWVLGCGMLFYAGGQVSAMSGKVSQLNQQIEGVRQENAAAVSREITRTITNMPRLKPAN